MIEILVGIATVPAMLLVANEVIRIIYSAFKGWYEWER